MGDLTDCIKNMGFTIKNRMPLAPVVRGGEAVAVGSFGCVFSPGIPCKGDVAGMASGAYANTVSKVMMPGEATKEFDETFYVRAMRPTLPSWMHDSLVVPLRPPCKVQFTPVDLLNSAKMCKNFDEPIRSNLGTYASRVLSLTQPYGGVTVGQALSRFTADTFTKVNRALITLLDVVRSMNLHGGIHGDIKAANVVYSAVDNKARLIDWGFFHMLSAEYTNLRWEDKECPAMFNAMVSTWMYSLDVATVPEPTAPLSAIIDWAYGALGQWMDTPGFEASNRGHMGVLQNYLFFCLSSAAQLGMDVQLPLYTSKTLHPLSAEMTNVLMAHAIALVQADFKHRFAYFVDTVYRLNQDIYGLLTCYFRVSEIMIPSALNRLSYQIAFTAGRYMFDPKYAVEPYDLEEMKWSLTELNGGVCKAAPFAAPLDPTANVRIMDTIDPKGWRAFSSATFNEAAYRADPKQYNLAQIYPAMTAAPPSALSASLPPPPLPPLSPLAPSSPLPSPLPDVPGGAPAERRVNKRGKTSTDVAFGTEGVEGVERAEGPAKKTCYPALVPLHKSDATSLFSYCTISGGYRVGVDKTQSGVAFGMKFLY